MCADCKRVSRECDGLAKVIQVDCLGVRRFDIGLLRPDSGAIAAEQVDPTGINRVIVTLITVDASGGAVLVASTHGKRIT